MSGRVVPLVSESRRDFLREAARGETEKVQGLRAPRSGDCGGYRLLQEVYCESARGKEALILDVSGMVGTGQPS